MRKRTGYLMLRTPKGEWLGESEGKKKRGIWYACWTVAGKKFKKTTSKPDHRDAETELHRIMEPFVAGDELASLQNIAARIERRKAEIARFEDERNPPPAIGAVWAAYERAGNRKEISDGTLSNYGGYWKAFTRWLANAHSEVKTLQEVTFEVCEDYKEHLTALKVTGRTFNAHRAFLRSFFNVLADKAKLTENPWAKIAKRDEHSLSRRPLTVEELRRVCRSAEGELRVMLAFGLYLGARMGDAACMEWGNVDLVRRLIRYTPRKTARKNSEPLLIPIHPELLAILNETPAANRTGYVTPGMAKDYLEGRPYAVSLRIQRHFEKCGISTTGERTGAGVRRHVVAGFHSLRHSAVSLMREAGAAQSISQAIVGHTSAEVHQLYTHADEGALRRAVTSLPAVLGDALEPVALPPTDPLSLVKARVRELAERLTNKTAGEIRVALLKLTNSET